MYIVAQQLFIFVTFCYKTVDRKSIFCILFVIGCIQKLTDLTWWCFKTVHQTLTKIKLENSLLFSQVNSTFLTYMCLCAKSFDPFISIYWAFSLIIYMGCNNKYQIEDIKMNLKRVSASCYNSNSSTVHTNHYIVCGLPSFYILIFRNLWVIWVLMFIAVFLNSLC